MRERALAVGGTLEAGPPARRRLAASRPTLPVGSRRDSGCCWSTTRRWCGPASGCCSTPRPTSRSSARPPTGGGGRPGGRDPARRRAHGHPDAPARRARGHRADRRRPGPVRHPGRGAHDVRARRVRLRRAAGGCLGLPPQGHRAGGAHRRGAPRRRRPGAAGAGRDPAADRGVRRGHGRLPTGPLAGLEGADRRRGCSPSSPRGSARSSPSSAAACPTTRSPSTWCSPR